MEAFLGQKRAATPADPLAALRAFFEVTSPAGTTAPSQQQGKCKGCGHQMTMRSDRMIPHFAPNKTGAGSWSKYKVYRICSENMAAKKWRFGFQLYGQALPCQGCQDRQLVLDSLSRGSNPVNRHLGTKPMATSDHFSNFRISAFSAGFEECVPLQATTPITTSKRVSCCLLYTSPSPRDQRGSRMPSSA